MCGRAFSAGVLSVSILLLSVSGVTVQAQVPWPGPGETLYITENTDVLFSEAATLTGTVVTTGSSVVLNITNNTSLDFLDFHLVTTEGATTNLNNALGSMDGTCILETTQGGCLNVFAGGTWGGALNLTNNAATTNILNEGFLSSVSTMVNTGAGNLSIQNNGLMQVPDFRLTTEGAHTVFGNYGRIGGESSWMILDRNDDTHLLNSGDLQLDHLSLMAEGDLGYLAFLNGGYMELGELVLHAYDGGSLDINNLLGTIRAGTTDIATLGLGPKSGELGTIAFQGNEIEPLQPIPAPPAIGLVVVGLAPVLLRARRGVKR